MKSSKGLTFYSFDIQRFKFIQIPPWSSFFKNPYNKQAKGINNSFPKKTQKKNLRLAIGDKNRSKYNWDWYLFHIELKAKKSLYSPKHLILFVSNNNLFVTVEKCTKREKKNRVNVHFINFLVQSDLSNFDFGIGSIFYFWVLVVINCYVMMFEWFFMLLIRLMSCRWCFHGIRSEWFCLFIDETSVNLIPTHFL